MTAVRRRRLARRLAAPVLTLVALTMFAPDASAQPPQRVGWWNRLAAGGAAAPAPTAPAGGMRVTAGPGQVLAFGAVLYFLPDSVPVGSTARLTLTLVSTQGMPVLQACPTKGVGWKAGADQPFDSAPAYDCSVSHYPGTLSADGTSITFDITTVAPATAGRLSLAIVPDLGAASGSAGPTAPFSTDLAKPGVGSLSVAAAPRPPSSQPPSPAPTPVRQQATPPAAPAPVAAGQPLGVPVPPIPPPDTKALAPTGPAPQVAPSATPAQSAVSSEAPSAAGAASKAGSVIGGLALVAALMYWGLGRGLLGGRIVPLSMPLTRVVAAPRTQPETGA